MTGSPEFPSGERPWFVRPGPKNFSQRYRNASIRFSHHLLTLKEMGYTNYQIANCYKISESTVRKSATEARKRRNLCLPLPPRNCTNEPTKDEQIADLKTEVKRLRRLICDAATKAKENMYEQ